MPVRDISLHSELRPPRSESCRGTTLGGVAEWCRGERSSGKGERGTRDGARAQAEGIGPPRLTGSAKTIQYYRDKQSVKSLPACAVNTANTGSICTTAAGWLHLVLLHYSITFHASLTGSFSGGQLDQAAVYCTELNPRHCETISFTGDRGVGWGGGVVANAPFL